MQKDDWYKHWFNTRDYLELYSHRDDEDARRLIGLLFNNISLDKRAKVLDLACGNGRHSVLFAKKGFNTFGIDLSPYLIKEAKKLVKKQYRGRLKFGIMDMRHLKHFEEFDLVVNLFSS